MILLIDFDSILYTSVYKIVSFSQMRNAIKNLGKEKSKQWIMEEVYNEGVNRCDNSIIKIENHLKNIFFGEITGIELFITTCTKSFRKELSKNYKVNRKKNKYVWLLREYYKHNGAFYDDILEADDLISIRAKELGKDNCIVVSIDKDLKQIGGFFWSYYKVRSKDSDGNYIVNDLGGYESEYKQSNIDFITEKEADYFFWEQMLMGDSADNIQGIFGIGKKKAEKILEDAPINWVKVAREYISREKKEDFRINYQLLKLI